MGLTTGRELPSTAIASVRITSHTQPTPPAPNTIAFSILVTPPTTTPTLPPATSSGWYLQPTVKLTAYPHANSTEDGMDYSEYWLDGAATPTRYTGPFQISGDGQHTLVYRSVDQAGNVEDPKTVTVGVINLPPLTLQAVPNILNLRTSGGLVNTVITVPAGYDLRAWGVADIRAEGSPAVTASYSVRRPNDRRDLQQGGLCKRPCRQWRQDHGHRAVQLQRRASATGGEHSGASNPVGTDPWPAPRRPGSSDHEHSVRHRSGGELIHLRSKEENVRNLWKGGLAILAVIAISTLGVTEALAQARAWVPKPTELPPYVNPHKPLTKLSEVLADKDPSVSWRHQVVDDSSLKAAWVGLKPGDATRTKQVADHQSAFIVWDGSVQVAIQGQTTFIATKGHIIRVPFRLTYTLTNVGATPSLHFEIFDARRIFLYPQAAANLPMPPKGTVWYQITTKCGRRYLFATGPAGFPQLHYDPRKLRNGEG